MRSLCGTEGNRLDMFVSKLIVKWRKSALLLLECIHNSCTTLLSPEAASTCLLWALRTAGGGLLDNAARTELLSSGKLHRGAYVHKHPCWS